MTIKSKTMELTCSTFWLFLPCSICYQYSQPWKLLNESNNINLVPFKYISNINKIYLNVQFSKKKKKMAKSI